MATHKLVRDARSLPRLLKSTLGSVALPEFLTNNAAFDTTPDSFDSINGYLTAETWYRPKQILENGTTWRPSKEGEKRPLLMVWQPDRTTKINLLNAFKDLGVLKIKDTFSAGNTNEELNVSLLELQRAIERRIYKNDSTDWLRTAISKFVGEQTQWNITSEQPGGDHLQGGALAFGNSDLSADANSGYRLLNRTPTNQTGVQRYFTDNSLGGFELLLANDVDNSNPVVQAEQLNWLHYLLNFGDITGNGEEESFDSIRVDAVDNVDADLLQISANYLKARYGVGKNDAETNKHLSILEDWSANDAHYLDATGNDFLTIDGYAQTQLKYSLTRKLGERSSMRRFLEFKMIDRANNTTENQVTPNYSFIRAHDSEVQTVIGDIIKVIHPEVTNSLAPTQEALADAFKVYNADMLTTDKEYVQYNIPATYAMLLTNKDTVPRPYYGDLFADDGQYMAKKTPYYDTIDNLLVNRVRFVSGGQTTNVDKHDILTSVRFGKGALTADAMGPDVRNTGIGVVVSNNPKVDLAGDVVTLKMGRAHTNQKYQAIVLSKVDGIDNFDLGDTKAPTFTTDANGVITLDAKTVKGVHNPLVSGFLAVLVPADAKPDQDARTQASDDNIDDGATLHSNAALDSHVIYESFSNFIAKPTKVSEYMNTKIAENVALFKRWGITVMQFPPQYRSSTDTSFLDAIVQNGYAFTDRYDLGFGEPTKYGTDFELRKAIKAVKSAGIQAMADFVPDQIYNLGGDELVTATRTNAMGTPKSDSAIKNKLYVARTRGGGPYQARYGGAFFDVIKARYPRLFKTPSISTGIPIDPSVKITEWSAKYFNGSDIQGRGDSFVLADTSQGYFKVTSNVEDSAFLPKQVLGESALSGFYTDADGTHYTSTSGYQVKKAFVHDDEQDQYYYFNASGNMVTGLQVIDGATYFFLANGVELRGAFMKTEDGNTHYFKKTGQMAVSQYLIDAVGYAYYFDEAGNMVKGLQTIDGNTQYFNEDGVQVKNAIVTIQGKDYFFKGGSGNLVKGAYFMLFGKFFYAKADGEVAKGLTVIKGATYYFDQTGAQVKGKTVVINGKLYAFDSKVGKLVTSGYFTQNGDWFYAYPDGVLATGFQVIGGKKQYFGLDGKQVKNKTFTISGKSYTADKAGNIS